MSTWYLIYHFLSRSFSIVCKQWIKLTAKKGAFRKVLCQLKWHFYSPQMFHLPSSESSVNVAYNVVWIPGRFCVLAFTVCSLYYSSLQEELFSMTVRQQSHITYFWEMWKTHYSSESDTSFCSKSISFIMRTLPFHRWCFLDECMNFLQVGVCEDFEGSCTLFPPFQLFQDRDLSGSGVLIL